MNNMYGYQQYSSSFQNNPYLNYGYPQNYPQLNGYQQSPIQQQTQQDVLQGKYVDNIDVVRAQNADMNGNVVWYPKSDKTEVYCKGLNPSTGASYILTYKLSNDGVTNNATLDNNQIGQMITQLQNDFVEFKNMILKSIEVNSKEGMVK